MVAMTKRLILFGQCLIGLQFCKLFNQLKCGLIFKEIYLIGQINNSCLLFYYFQPGRDFSGAAIALFTANLHSPLNVNHKTTLQGVVYQLDVALQSSETQKSGLVFIYDMSSSKYSNFDYDLSQKILTLLKVSDTFFNLFK